MMLKRILFLILLLTLTGCGAFGQKTPAALPTVVLGEQSTAQQTTAALPAGVAAASGKVAPARDAQLASAAAGNILALDVIVGARVEAGQVLARFAGAEQLQASLSAAELEVFNAQQALDSLTDDLQEAQVAALQALKDARDAVHLAEQKITGLGEPSEPIDIQVARSNVALALRALEQAQKDFRPYENKPENNFNRAALLSKLSDAQKRYDNAVRQLNRLTGVIVPEFDQQQAQTDLEIAQGRLALAEQDVELLDAGPDPDAVALAERRLQAAEDQAAAIRSRLADLELKAPFSGTVTQVNYQAGEWAAPGVPILALADLDDLRIETTDLSERDIPSVEVGQTVTVLVKPLNLTIKGQVLSIDPLASILGGDVVYTAIIVLDEIPDGLRAGMSVEVQFD